MTARGNGNLRRGGVPATAEAAARARRAKAEQRDRDTTLAEAAASDPWGAYDELHVVMTAHITKLLRDEHRTNSKPSRAVTDRLREYRVTTEALSQYRSTHRSALDDASEFFEGISNRLESLLGPNYLSILNPFPLADITSGTNEAER